MDLTTGSEIAPTSLRTELSGLPYADLLRRAEDASPSEARAALSRIPLSLEDAAILLKSRDEALLDELTESARVVTNGIFGKKIQLYAPCYLSSFCVNHCRYCGYNFTMPIRRRWLSPARALEEIEFLAHRGFKRILLVAGESPAIVDTEYLARTLAGARSLVPDLDIEVGPGSEEDYRRWREAGAGGVVCYQETYDPVVYAHMHPRGLKSRYAARLETLDRAALAGIPRLGLGVLLGLAEPERDILALIAHARFLGRAFPEAHLSVSLPRIRPAGTPFKPLFTIEDEQMPQLFSVLRLSLPHAEMAVTTREPEWLRARLLRTGITLMSAESVTVPGAYTECGHEGGQFEVLDHRSLEEVRWDVEDLGYEVH